jgi:serine/threonine protein kinase/tetratricopeptide (TPR) repeat protein
MADKLSREEAIFHNALEIEDADRRAAYLAAACGDQRDLRRRVEALLRRCAESHGPLDRRAWSPAATTDEPIAECPGSMIGPYKLKELIGEGGMGLVFVADQYEPIKRRVALKVIKPGMDSRQVIARFEAERQALAMMDHPNIAHVLDAGTTASGRPYFVMELVKGIPITDYCDQHKLTTRQRLEVFLPVCQAVQHAHQKGIIHRDLKPSNVLVTLHDVTPVVKIIDFGIAKAMGQQLTDRSVYTGFSQLVGTPLYMSPEQAGLSGLDVDTRSDIYSLGVLLYELLTGTTPFDAERLKEVDYDEMRRIIREDEPPRPSTRLSTLQGVALATVAASHGVEPRRLSQQVRGELDWIVMKCLEKDRSRRYETASALACDIERHLHDEPVEACPPRVGYRLRKFLRKHRAGVLVSALLGVFLVVAVVGLAVSNWLIRREQEETRLERDRTEEARQAEVKRRELAQRALRAMSSHVILDWLARQKELLPKHKEFLRQALTWYEELAAEQSEDEAARAGVAEAFLRIGNIRRLLGQMEEAESALGRSVTLGKQLVADYPAVPVHRRALVTSQITLGQVKAGVARWAQAEIAYREALTSLENIRHQAPSDPDLRYDVGVIHHSLGVLLMATNRPSEAESTWRRAVSIQEPLSKDFPQNSTYLASLALSHNSLGILLTEQGRLVEARTAYREALAIQHGLSKDFPDVPAYRQDLARSYANLGNLLQKLGKRAEAETALHRSVTIREELVRDYRNVTEYAVDLGGSYCNFGNLLGRRGQAEAALDWYVRAISTLKPVLDKDARLVTAREFLGNSYRGQALTLAGQRRYADSLPAWDRALELTAGQGRPRLRLLRAMTLAHLGDHRQAAAEANALAASNPAAPATLYDLACVYALCVAAAQQETKRPETERSKLAEAYAARALGLLSQAVQQGFSDPGMLLKDADLNSLRSRPDFQLLLCELTARKKQS